MTHSAARSGQTVNIEERDRDDAKWQEAASRAQLARR